MIATAFRTAVPRSERRTAPPGGARTALGSRPHPIDQTVARWSTSAAIVDGQDHAIVVRGRRDYLGTSGSERIEQDGRALGDLGAGLPDAEPDLAVRARAAGSRCATRPGSRPSWAPVRNDQGVTRAAELGIRIGILPSGPTGSIVDVPGVGVGHATVWRDEPPPPAGRGVARTGVTVIDIGGNLFRSPVPAGGAVLNGAGECTGFLAADEWGLAETPVFLTSTMQLGRVYDAACELLMEEDPGIGCDDVIIPIVAECDDSFLNDARRMQVTRADVATALADARASVGGRAPAEGAVGAGTGMSCLGFKGGIGTASRLTPSGHTVGVLLLSNFGARERLTVDGVPVGRLLPPAEGDARRISGLRGLVHRGRRDRRPGGLGRVRPAGPAGRPGAGPDGIHGQPRQRRDLHGAGDGPARPADRRAGARAPGARGAQVPLSGPGPEPILRGGG